MITRWICLVIVMAALIGSIGAASAGDPMLSISSPSSGAVVTSDTITVSGSAMGTGGAVVESVTVNGRSASGTTSWSATVSLHAGSNTITVRATDNAGGTATKTITVVYDEPIPTPTPTPDPTPTPSPTPTPTPSPTPTSTPTSTPTTTPTTAPTVAPTTAPTTASTIAPTVEPTVAPTTAPTTAPTKLPTTAPTVVPTPEDTSPPAVRIDKPVIIEYNNNGVLEEGEKVTIIYGANDPSGVASIKILLDGTMLESQNQAGTYTITTNPLTMGKHIIKVEATDSKSNRGFEELPVTVERTGPSVYFGTTRTTINKGEDAIFTLSAVNPIGNPSMTVQLILKPPSGVSVTSSSFAKGASGIYTCTQVIESGDNVRSIEVHLTGNEVGTHEIESEVYYQFEGSPKSPTRYETLTLVVDDHDSTPLTPTPKPSPGFAAVVAVIGLLAAYLKRTRI